MGEQSDLQEQEVTTPDFGFAGEISTASMVRVLVKKGIVTSSELLDEERDRRDSILSSVKMRERGSHEHETATRFPRLKRWASKKRWRRRITGILMGWKWKKIRHHKKTETSHSDQEQI
ncbi:MAG: hypothetical protein U5R06_15955 [candidate division KSB1 bacterium]|nr:hypothetical protein [candidate division KSB1 bacterium]